MSFVSSSHSLTISSTIHIDNQTLMNSHEFYQYSNHLLHLFILTSVWIILILTIVFGTTGNLLVLYVYINRNDKKTCSFFIKILAIVDLLICFLLAPLELYQTTIGIRNEYLCKFYGFFTTHVLYSTFLITFIAFDRYFCICWPLYKIITIHRARIIVVVGGLLSSLLAIIPMSEYSTIEHILQLHGNHSEKLSFASIENNDIPIYTHVEHFTINDPNLPFILGNITHVKCSPRFSLQIQLSKYILPYRLFHSVLFAICMCFVLILYAFIYKAVHQRRVNRAKKLSTYHKILRSYFLESELDQSSMKRSFFSCCCCCCCPQPDHYHRHHHHHGSSLSQSIHHRTYSHHQTLNNSYQEDISPKRNRPEQIVLELNGARGKRYSAISMTSMTYLTSGVWDDPTSSNLLRSRINSITATTFCGTEQTSNTSRPSTSTDDSSEQSNRSVIPNPKYLHLKLPTVSNTTHLMVPGQPISPSPSSENSIKDHCFNEFESTTNSHSPSSSTTTNFLHPSIVRKSSITSSNRHVSRTSDISIPQRKVSFMVSTLIPTNSIVDDSPSTYLHSSCISSSHSPSFHHQESLDTIDHSSTRRHPHSSQRASNIRTSNFSSRNSITSTRRSSTFDNEAQNIIERQQRQERRSNIRTTITLFIVTATFILMYLPSISITIFNMKPNEYREILFLLYFINSACNPLIYSFFNVNFRNDIRRIYECQKREYLARSS